MATAGPKKNARARVIVKQIDARGDIRPVLGAKVIVVGKEEGSTNRVGEWISRMFDPGEYGLQVNLPGFGPRPGDPCSPPDPNGERPYTNHPDSYMSVRNFTASTKADPHNLFAVTMVQYEPRVSLRVMNPGYHNQPVRGASVRIVNRATKAPIHEGATDRDGKYLSAAFPLAVGSEFELQVSKPYHEPALWLRTGKVEGGSDHSFQADLSGSVPPVQSANIRVKGQPFATWFNKDFKTNPRIQALPNEHTPGAKLFAANVPQVPFENVFNNIDKWWLGPTLTLEEFIGMFCIMYNETGGCLMPIAENKNKTEEESARRCFNEIEGDKYSYNGGGNRLAGNQINEMIAAKYPNEPDKKLNDQELARWNGKTWPEPAPGSELYQMALECDFYKYRGRGLVQITYRGTYLRHVDRALRAAGHPGSDALPEKELTRIVLQDDKVYFPMVKFYLQGVQANRGAGIVDLYAVNQFQWRKMAAGFTGSPRYHRTFDTRCEALYTEMTRDGFEFLPHVNP